MSEESEREEIKDETHQLQDEEQEELDDTEDEEEQAKTMEESTEVEWEEGSTAIAENNHLQYYRRCTKDIEAPIQP